MDISRQVHTGDMSVDVTTQRSFDDFYDGAAHSVAGALTATLGDRELAADAMAEAMVRAWQRWDKIATYDKPEAWVYRVAMNWALSWKRRRRRERERPVSLGSDRTELSVRDDSLDQALAALSIDHRGVIVCRLHLDWSVAESAEALGIAPGTVKSRLARALAELKKHLDQDPGHDDQGAGDLATEAEEIAEGTE